MQGELLLVAHARATDPETSHEAAASLTSDRLRESQYAVLDALIDHGPICDADLVDAYMMHGYAPRQSPSGIRTRRKELVALGKVRAAGHTVLSSGRRAIVWEVL